MSRLFHVSRAAQEAAAAACSEWKCRPTPCLGVSAQLASQPPAPGPSCGLPPVREQALPRTKSQGLGSELRATSSVVCGHPHAGRGTRLWAHSGDRKRRQAGYRQPQARSRTAVWHLEGPLSSTEMNPTERCRSPLCTSASSAGPGSVHGPASQTHLPGGGSGRVSAGAAGGGCGLLGSRRSLSRDVLAATQAAPARSIAAPSTGPS